MFPQDAAQALQQAREDLATDLSRHFNTKWPYSPGEQPFDRLAIYFHLDNLTEALINASPSIFVDYAHWFEIVLDEGHVSQTVLPDVMNATREVLHRHIDPAFADLASTYIDKALGQLGKRGELPPTHVREDAPLADLASAYLTALLDTDRQKASRLILDAVEGGIPVKEIYLHVFQVAQYEIGRLWQINRVTVAQEHYCTAATQLIMSQLYPYIFSTERNGHSMVAASISGELHELGIRMVADLFEMAGWDTYYLGASTPVNSIISEVLVRRADVLAVSVSLHANMPKLRTLVQQVRKVDIPHPLWILVGGYPFNANPGLWKSVGADGSAADAQQAVALANGFVGLEPPS